MNIVKDEASLLEKLGKLIDKKKYDDALKLSNEIIELFPDSVRAYRERGAIKLINGNHAEAIEDYNKVVKLGSKEPSDYYDLGRTLLKLGKNRDAVIALSQALELGKQADFSYYEMACYFFRAEAYLRLQDYQKTLADCECINDGYKSYINSPKTKEDIIAEARAGISNNNQRSLKFE